MKAKGRLAPGWSPLSAPETWGSLQGPAVPSAREAAAAAAGGGGRGTGRGHRPPACPPCTQSLAILSRDPGPVFTTCARTAGGEWTEGTWAGGEQQAPGLALEAMTRVPPILNVRSEN